MSNITWKAGSLCGLRKSSECNKTMERETSAIQPWQISFSFIYLHSPNKAWPKNVNTKYQSSQTV